MNAFNRLIMLVIALLLIAVPVLLFWIGFRILPAEQVSTYVPYRGALDALDTLAGFSFDAGARTVTAIIRPRGARGAVPAPARYPSANGSRERPL